MTSVIIIGDKDSGRTTFLGLLYASAVEYASASVDRFRLHAPPESLNVLSSIYEQLRVGHFPDETTREKVISVNFLLGYKKSALGRLFGGSGGKKDEGGFSTMDFTALRSPDGIVSKDDSYRILDCDTLVILVDCSVLHRGGDAGSTRIAQYDGELSELGRALAERNRRRAEMKEKQKLVRPVIVFTKADSISHGALKKLNIKREKFIGEYDKNRKEYSDTLMKEFLPGFYAMALAKGKGEACFAEPVFYLSWTVHGWLSLYNLPEQTEKKDKDIDLLSKLNYSKTEFRAMLEWFGKVA